MAFAFALTLPALVVGLVVFALVARLVGRRRLSAAGVEVLGTALAPAQRHVTDERNRVELDRDEDAEGAPPRTRVDLPPPLGGPAVIDTPEARQTLFTTLIVALKNVPSPRRCELVDALAEALGVGDFSPLDGIMMTWSQLRDMREAGVH